MKLKNLPSDLVTSRTLMGWAWLFAALLLIPFLLYFGHPFVMDLWDSLVAQEETVATPAPQPVRLSAPSERSAPVKAVSAPAVKTPPSASVKPAAPAVEEATESAEIVSQSSEISAPPVSVPTEPSLMPMVEKLAPPVLAATAPPAPRASPLGWVGTREVLVSADSFETAQTNFQAEIGELKWQCESTDRGTFGFSTPVRSYTEGSIHGFSSRYVFRQSVSCTR